MRALVYWIARHKTDHACYSVRGRTRKECELLLKCEPPGTFAKPVKVTIPYDDVFDLAKKLLSEGGESMYYPEPADCCGEGA